MLALARYRPQPLPCLAVVCQRRSRFARPASSGWIYTTGDYDSRYQTLSLDTMYVYSGDAAQVECYIGTTTYQGSNPGVLSVSR